MYITNTYYTCTDHRGTFFPTAMQVINKINMHVCTKQCSWSHAQEVTFKTLACFLSKTHPFLQVCLQTFPIITCTYSRAMMAPTFPTHIPLWICEKCPDQSSAWMKCTRNSTDLFSFFFGFGRFRLVVQNIILWHNIHYWSRTHTSLNVWGVSCVHSIYQ